MSHIEISKDKAHDQRFSIKESKKEALTFALLETVRLVLASQDREETEEQFDFGILDHYPTSSGHTSDSDHQAVAQRKKVIAPRIAIPGGPCAHCGATESPQWRRPLTKKVVLCNACGIYYSRHHSLPKRKKVPGTCKQASGENEGIKQNHVMTEDEDCDQMICDEPAAVLHELSSLAECMQEESQGHHVLVHLESTLNKNAALACASPARSYDDSLMHCVSGVAVPPSTPKKRTDDYLESLFEAHADDSKRAIKRVAMAQTAGSQVMGLQMNTGLQLASFPSGDSIMASRGSTITTSLAAMQDNLDSSDELMALLQQSQAQQYPLMSTVYALAGLPHVLMAPTGFIKNSFELSTSVTHGEQTDDTGMTRILIPTSTCRGPRSNNLPVTLFKGQ